VAPLYGYLASDRPGTVTRASQRRIMAQLQTWEDRLTLQLARDGAFELWREPGPNGCGPRILIASGNVRDLGRIVSDTDAISSDALVALSGYLEPGAGAMSSQRCEVASSAAAGAVSVVDKHGRRVA